jgi:copper chaperone CopZ
MKSTLYIQNLKCKGCEATIINTLSKLNNISNVLVDLQRNEVKFDYKTKEDIENIKKELSKLGYPPYGEKNNLVKKAKSYVSCAIGKTHK